MPVRIKIKHKGSLGGPHFFSKINLASHRKEEELSRKIGERKVLGKLEAIEVFNKNRNPALSRKAKSDIEHLASHYGRGRGYH